jgi:hypothetical protein
LRALVAILILMGAVLQSRAAEFAVFDIFLDTKGEPLAAYQLKVSDKNAAVKIISVEGGEHLSFAAAPKFDPKAIQRDVIKLAAISLDGSEKLPTSRVRIASLHVEVGLGLTPDWSAIVERAGRVGGEKIDATISISKRENQ